MKNAGIAGGLVAIGLGLATIGLSNFSRNANAVPAAALPAGPEEPQIVWYGISQNSLGELGVSDSYSMLYRAWSDGRVEAKKICTGRFCPPTNGFESGNWEVVADQTEGLNAAADINFDEIVDGGDLGVLLARWGDAPRSPIPASDCPLGLMQ
jgi:hypothetical protein